MILIDKLGTSSIIFAFFNVNFWCFHQIITCLNDEIKQDILAKFVAIKNININTFISLLYCFKDLRNKISHNEPIYKFKFYLHKLVYKTWLFDSRKSWTNLKEIIINDLNQLLLVDHSLKSNFKLYWVIKIIAKVTNNFKLVTLFKQKANKLALAIGGSYIISEVNNNIYLPCEKAWNNVSDFLGYDSDWVNKTTRLIIINKFIAFIGTHKFLYRLS